MIPGKVSSVSNSHLWTPRASKRDKKRHPVFQDAAEETDDPYWTSVLVRCAENHFPKNFYYAGGRLTHRQNRVSIVLPDTPSDVAKTAIFFFQEQGQLYSAKDRQERHDRDQQGVISTIIERSLDWKKVASSKNRRSTHIRDYVERVYGDMSKAARQEMCTIIEIAFELRLIGKEDIDFQNGRIVDIDGVGIKDGSVSFKHADVTLPPKKIVPPTKDKVYRHHDNWKQWVTSFRKYTELSSRACHAVIYTSELS